MTVPVTAAVRGAGVDAVYGIGGAPKGVITAAAIRCLHGQMVGRLVVDTPELRSRVEHMGIGDPHRAYTADELAPGKHLVFAACGVTTGALLTGVRFFGCGYRTHAIVMTLDPTEVRFIDSIRITADPAPRGVRLISKMLAKRSEVAYYLILTMLTRSIGLILLLLTPEALTGPARI